MSQNEMVKRIDELKEWESILEEAQTMVEQLKDEIKQVMLENGTEEMQVGPYIVRWTETISSRLDTAAMKKQYKDLYTSFLKQITSRRFSIA